MPWPGFPPLPSLGESPRLPSASEEVPDEPAAPSAGGGITGGSSCGEVRELLHLFRGFLMFCAAAVILGWQKSQQRVAQASLPRFRQLKPSKPLKWGQNRKG